MMGQDEDRNVVRRIVAPPAQPASGHAPRIGPNMWTARIQGAHSENHGRQTHRPLRRAAVLPNKARWEVRVGSSHW